MSDYRSPNQKDHYAQCRQASPLRDCRQRPNPLPGQRTPILILCGPGGSSIAALSNLGGPKVPRALLENP
jgi:hypothetical protein